MTVAILGICDVDLDCLRMPGRERPPTRGVGVALRGCESGVAEGADAPLAKKLLCIVSVP